MSAFFRIAKLLISLLPIIVSAVKAAESAFPEKGSGSQKLKMVREILEAAYVSAGNLVDTFQEAWPAIKKVIDTTVSIFNALGIFK